jgi:hypothetical protein
MNVFAPSNPAGVYDVSLQNLIGPTATLPAAFKVTGTAAPLTIAKVDPPGGSIAGNQSITLEGTNIAAAYDPNSGAVLSPQVTFGGKPAQVTYVDGSFIQIQTAPAPAGAVDIVVTNADGSSVTIPHGFAYGVPAATGLSASHGRRRGGEYLSVFGANFQDGAIVTFGGESAEVLSHSSAFLGLRTPRHAAGVVDVVVANPDGTTVTLPSAFTYAH